MRTANVDHALVVSRRVVAHDGMHGTRRVRGTHARLNDARNEALALFGA